MNQVFGGAIGQGPFELIPDKLIGIKLGSISREPVDMETGMFGQKFFDHFTLVRCAAVPEQDDGSAQVSVKMFEKPDHLGRTDVFVAVELGVKRNLSSFRGNRKRRDSRDFCPASGNRKMGCFSFRRPSTNHVGHQEKPTFIQEDQIGPQLLGFFLYGAISSASSDRYSPGFFPGLVSPASGSSSPDESEIATGDWGGTPRRIPFRLPGQPSFGSTGRWKNPKPKLLSKESWLISPSDGNSAWENGREQAWVSRNPALLFCTGLSTGLPNCGKNRLSGQQPTPSNRFPTTGGRVGAAVPVAFGFQMVSCVQDTIYS